MDTCYHCLLDGKVTKPDVLVTMDRLTIHLCNKCYSQLAIIKKDSKTEYRTRLLKSHVVGKEYTR